MEYPDCPSYFLVYFSEKAGQASNGDISLVMHSVSFGFQWFAFAPGENGLRPPQVFRDRSF